MNIEVRRATAADAHAIAEVHVRCWREAFAHLVPAENLARLNVGQRELRWNEILPFPWANIWVAIDGEEVVGFAGSSENREPDTDRELQLQALHVIATHYGTGAAQQLLDTVLGDATAVLWVADNSPRASAFYARNRFKPDGITKTGPVAGTDIVQNRLVR